MNPNLPPIGKHSATVIDRDALATAFNVPAGFNDRQTNFWLANSRPGGVADYQSPDTLDMDLLRSLMLNGDDASVEALNESLATMAGVMNGNESANDPAARAAAERAALGAPDERGKIAAPSPLVPAQAKSAVIGLSVAGMTFRNEVAARLRGQDTRRSTRTDDKPPRTPVRWSDPQKSLSWLLPPARRGERPQKLLPQVRTIHASQTWPDATTARATVGLIAPELSARVARGGDIGRLAALPEEIGPGLGGERCCLDTLLAYGEQHAADTGGQFEWSSEGAYDTWAQ